MNFNLSRDARAHALTRRFLLKSAVAMAAVTGATCANANPLNGAISLDDFGHLSKFLVGRQNLDALVIARAFTSLTALDVAFPKKALALQTTLRQANLRDMTQFNDFIARFPALKPVAMMIISAFYLGFCGTYDEHAVPAVGQPVDTAQFVSYAAALMYAPTIDATVIPSYARGHTNYWFYPPKTIAND